MASVAEVLRAIPRRQDQIPPGQCGRIIAARPAGALAVDQVAGAVAEAVGPGPADHQFVGVVDADPLRRAQGDRVRRRVVDRRSDRDPRAARCR